MKKKIIGILTAILSMAVAVGTLTSCEKSNGNTLSGGGSVADWDDAWGDGWGDEGDSGFDIGEYDPSENYNTINWSEMGYASYDNAITAVKYFSPLLGAQRYEAENETQVRIEDAGSDGARVQEGYYLGYLKNSTVSFYIDTATPCDVLLVAALAVDPDESKGVAFADQYAVNYRVNGSETYETVDVSDAWMKPTNAWNNFALNPVGTLHLYKGETKISFVSGADKSNIDAILLVPKTESMSETPVHTVNDLKVEAEGTKMQGCQIERGTDGTYHSSYAEANSTLEFIVNADKAGSYQMSALALMSFSSGKSKNIAERFAVEVNGQTLSLSGTVPSSSVGGNWWEQPYVEIPFGNIQLAEGNNSVKITVLQEETNVDYFGFKPILGSVDFLKIEAEAGTIESGCFATDGGTGYILGYIDNAVVEYTVYSQAEMDATLVMNGVVRNDAGSVQTSNHITLTLNGTAVELSDTIPAVSGSDGNWWDKPYQDMTLATVHLQAGENVLRFTFQKSMNVDYFTLTCATAE